MAFLAGLALGFAGGYAFALVGYVLGMKDPPLNRKIHDRLHRWGGNPESCLWTFTSR